MPRFLTTEQVAELLHVKPETVRYWRWRGKLKAYKPGGKPLFREDEILAFVEAHREGAQP